MSRTQTRPFDMANHLASEEEIAEYLRQVLEDGDPAELAGALGDKGPNVGKRVTVGTLRGEHSQHGRIWRVHGEGLITEYGFEGTEVDCAAAWLRNDPPAPLRPSRKHAEAQ